MNNLAPIVTQDPWLKLRQYTDARIALGRVGVSLPLKEHLKFKLAHAKARDAVHQPVLTEDVVSSIKARSKNVLLLRSMASDRMEYLTRPDKGRVLNKASKELLHRGEYGFDICIVICDGLSAPAVNETAATVVNGLMDIIDQTTIKAAPVCMVTNGRVAIGDEIGFLLKAKLIVTLIGERPGLSSPNSLGAYITYNPKPGTTDEARNCISNIRHGGMSASQAVKKISYLVEEGFRVGETGIKLKDKMNEDYIPLLSFTTD